LPAPPKSVADGALEHYEHPAYYDRAYAARSADVEFYVEQARGVRGPVLEYGVGSGRVALPLLRAGVSVVGVDHSQPMLDALKRGAAREDGLLERLRLVRGDMRSKRLHQRFALVIAPFNVVLHLYTRRDIERFFARVHEHLTPRGRFVFDFSVPRCEDLALDPERWWGGSRVSHPRFGKRVKYAERFHYARMTQVLTTWMRFTGDAATEQAVLTHRQYYPAEMDALLHYNGFVDCRWAGGFESEAPNQAADTLVVNCRSGRSRSR